jgi:integrase/recombinase XerD
MSSAGIPLRVIQEVSGHRTLTELQKYLEVNDAQIRGAVASLSLLSYNGKARFADSELELPPPPLLREKEDVKEPGYCEHPPASWE